MPWPYISAACSSSCVAGRSRGTRVSYGLEYQPRVLSAVRGSSMVTLNQGGARLESQPTGAVWWLQGEPIIQNIGWAATAAMFSFSLALVVWGRSGL